MLVGRAARLKIFFLTPNTGTKTFVYQMRKRNKSVDLFITQLFSSLNH